MLVTVECSANECRFKKNDGYYGVCRNPITQNEYKEFAGGQVQVSGCVCQYCKSNCGIVHDMF